MPDVHSFKIGNSTGYSYYSQLNFPPIMIDNNSLLNNCTSVEITFNPFLRRMNIPKLNQLENQSFSKNIDSIKYSFVAGKKKYIFRFKELSQTQKIPFEVNNNDLNYGRLGLIALATSSSVAVVHHYQSKAWWQQSRTKFHFQNDWEYALWIDKIGHWWGATAIQHLFSSGLSWSGYSLQTSMILGSVLAFSYQMYVETYDGYASNWGFSPGDALFDFGGAFYPLLQFYFAPLKNVNLKLSYYPSKRLLHKSPNDELYRNKFVIDDYEGQSFYLSFKINNMLPDFLEKFWPDFLCLAVGYQMRNWTGYAVADKKYYLALDYDFETLPLYGQFWQFLKNTLNLIHLPAPAIQFSKNKILLKIAY